MFLPFDGWGQPMAEILLRFLNKSIVAAQKDGITVWPFDFVQPEASFGGFSALKCLNDGIMLRYLYLFCIFISHDVFSQLPDRHVFIPEKGGFSITVPGGLMKNTLREVETEVGRLQYHTYAVDFTTEDDRYFAFIISYTDYPEGGMHSDSADLLQDFFNVAVKESVFLMKGKLVYESEENYLAYPGLVWRINYRNDKASVRNRSLMVESRYYLLQVISGADVYSGNIAQDYLDSFRLLD